MTEETPALEPTLTIALEPPVEVNKVTLTELALREPTLGQVRDAQMKLDDPVMSSPGAQREYELTFLQLNSSKGRALIDALPARVVRQGVEYLEAFVMASLPDPESADDTRMVIVLESPLKAANGGEVHEVELREPTGGELRKAEDLIGKLYLPGPVRRYQARLIEQVSGLSSLVVAQLPISKAKEAVRFLEGFELSARRTGTR